MSDLSMLPKNAYVVSCDLNKDFVTACKLTNRAPDEVINDLIQRFVHIYRGPHDNIIPLDAVYYKNRNPVLQKAWANEKHDEPLPDVKIPCKFLYDTTMYGNPYRAIVVDGAFLQVPAEEVELSY